MKRSPGKKILAPKTFSRRIALKAALAIPLLAKAAEEAAAAANSEQELIDLVKKTETQAKAFMRGDMDKWISMLRFASDFTLMQPFGGTTRGFDPSPERLARMASYFRNGDAKLELVQSYVSDDLIVLAMIEHQHGEVGGLPSQDWSLRVTQVYRRQGEQWWLIHRHADPLVRYVGLEPAAAIARGANPDSR